MRILYKYTNITVPQAMRDEFQKKLAKLPKWLNDKQPQAKLAIEFNRTTKHHKKGDVFRAEATLSIGKKTLRAEEQDQDLMRAFDCMRHTLEQEVSKFKRENDAQANREARKFKRMKGMTPLAWTGPGREAEQEEELEG